MCTRCPIGSSRSNSSSASFWLTTTSCSEAASSTSVNDRPGDTSPPATLGHAALRPLILTLCCVLAPKVTSARPPSSTATQLTDGTRSTALASPRDSGGLWRQGQLSSPSQVFTPPWKNRPTQNVLGPDRSRMSATPLLKPLMIAPITMTTSTPMATPRMVSAARPLCARNDSRAMPTPSSMGVMGSLLTQRGDGVEPRGAAGGIDAGDDPYPAAHDHPEHDRERRHGRWQRGGDLKQQRQGDARDDPEGGAHRRQRGGFREELAHDVAAPRPQRFADVDFQRPGRHRHEHDVHDDDPADDERDAHQAGPDGVQDAAQFVPEVQHAFRGHHGEVVVLARAEVAPAPHDGFG